MAIGKKNNVTISEALQAFIKKNNLQKGLTKIQVEAAWKKVMGPGVMSYTQSVLFKDDTLTVVFTSAVLKEELSMGKSKIIRLLNEELGTEVIKKVILR